MSSREQFLTERLAERSVELERLRALLENMRMAEIGKDLRIGVITENGAASAVIEGPHREVFQEWWELRSAALSRPKQGE
jgi:hypothetical protein